MKANKFTINIECTVLSKDTIAGLLSEVSENLSRENDAGTLCKSDGDEIKWRISLEEVEIINKREQK